MRAQTKLEELFGIDLRALAAFRISVALLIIFDLINRAPDLVAFYTDLGVLPREEVIRSTGFIPPSVYFLSGEAWVQGAWLIVQALCAVGLLLGWRTRWMTFLSWFLICSLQFRNPRILFGMDFYLRMLLFWSIFLPLGACWSVDNILKPSKTQRPLYAATWGTAALLLQNALVYIVTGMVKWGHATWHDGTALFYSLSVDVLIKPFADFMRLYPSILKIFTHGTLYLEIVGPLLLFIPFWTKQFRLLVVSLIIFMNFGIFLTMKLWLFPWVNIAAMIVFIPPWFWDRLPGSQVGRERPKPPAYPAESKKISACVICFFCAIFFWNLTVAMPSHFQMPPKLGVVYRWLHIDQNWKMFADPASFGSGWVSVAGTLRDGSRVHLLEGGSPFTWGKPENAKNFKSSRWRRYLTYLNRQPSDRSRKNFTKFLCRSWNANHPGEKRLRFVDIIIFIRKIDPESKRQVPFRKRFSFRGECDPSSEIKVSV